MSVQFETSGGDTTPIVGSTSRGVSEPVVPSNTVHPIVLRDRILDLIFLSSNEADRNKRFLKYSKDTAAFDKEMLAVEKDLAAARSALIGGLVSGGFSMVGGVVALKATWRSAEYMETPGYSEVVAQNITMAGRAQSELWSSSGAIGGTIATHDSEQKKILAEILRSEGTLQRRQADDISGFAQDSKATKDKVLDALDQIMNTEHETNLVAAN